MWKKKIKAFTLIELTLTMVIGGMVASMGYLGWEILERQFHLFKDRRTVQIEVFSWHSRLQKDLADAETIRGNANGWVLEMPNRPPVLYAWDDYQLFRSDRGMEEVFPFEVETVQLQWQGQPTLEAEDLVDQIKWTADYMGEIMQFSYSKTYGADRLMAKERQP